MTLRNNVAAMLHCCDALKIVGTICHRMERKKQTTLHVHRTFWYISKCPPCNYDVFLAIAVVFLLESTRKFTIFTQTTMPLEYIQNFAYLLSSISLGMTVVPWRNWRQWSSNISFFWGGGGDQRASWSM